MKPTEVGPNVTARASVLIGLVRKHGWELGAEIGVEAGHTHLALLDGCPDLHLVGVDNWTGNYRGRPRIEMYHDLVALTAPYELRSALLRGDSVEMSERVDDGTLDFIFVDANHGEASVRADIEAWAPKLRPSGWIAGHDYNLPGVSRAIRDLLPGHALHSEVSKVWSIPLAETRYAP